MVYLVASPAVLLESYSSTKFAHIAEVHPCVELSTGCRWQSLVWSRGVVVLVRGACLRLLALACACLRLPARRRQPAAARGAPARRSLEAAVEGILASLNMEACDQTGKVEAAFVARRSPERMVRDGQIP